VRASDIDFVLRYGTAIDGRCVVLTDRDADIEICRRKIEIERLERCRNCVVVATDASVLTAYRPESKRRSKTFSRRLRETATQ
jgi:hypothetical protein